MATSARTPDPAVRWDDLPDSAKRAAIGIAAQTLGSVPVAALPKVVAAVARFTPAKRARRGAAPIAQALANDVGFRALVAQHVPPTFGRDAHNPAHAAARAYLLQLPDSGEILEATAQHDELQALQGQLADLQDTVAALTTQLAAAVDRAEQAEAQLGESSTSEEADRLRQRLRAQGQRLKDATDHSAAHVAEAQAELQQAREQAQRESAAAAQWQIQAEQQAEVARLAHTALQRTKERSGQARSDADRRIALLLDSAQQAVAALRHEWHLTVGGVDPADVVARALPNSVVAPPHRNVDAALLLQWLQLPGAHLIIDGYNVTKTGYENLSLSNQRDRLVRSVAALTARTGADVTIVFDGADVIAPSASVARVRVIFSPHGVIADDVIRDLVAAEPVGRVLVVATSDQEIIDDVRAAGSRTTPSKVLLELLP